MQFRSLTQSLTTIGAMGKDRMTIMAAFAQLEQDQLSERTPAGLEVAALHGRVGGRPRITADDAKVQDAVRHKAQGLSITEIGKLLDISRPTVYRYLNAAT